MEITDSNIPATDDTLQQIAATLAIMAASSCCVAPPSIGKVFIAGEILGGQRLVKIQGGQAFYYDSTVDIDYGHQLGITNNAAIAGGLVTVVIGGIITSGGWGLVPDAIYYGTGTTGNLTTVIPVSGIFQRIGVAIDTDSMKLEFSEPIVIA